MCSSWYMPGARKSYIRWSHFAIIVERQPNFPTHDQHLFLVFLHSVSASNLIDRSLSIVSEKTMQFHKFVDGKKRMMAFVSSTYLHCSCMSHDCPITRILLAFNPTVHRSRDNFDIVQISYSLPLKNQTKTIKSNDRKLDLNFRLARIISFHKMFKLHLVQ